MFVSLVYIFLCLHPRLCVNLSTPLQPSFITPQLNKSHDSVEFRFLSKMDAPELFKQLQKEAECPVCLETVDNPKTLPCLHSFCLNCLKKIPVEEEERIDCPVCRTSVVIPETLIDLPTSFHLNRLLDILALRGSGTEAQRCGSCEEMHTAACYCFVCVRFMCTACFDSHQRTNGTRGHRNVLIENLQAQQVLGSVCTPTWCLQKCHDLKEPLKYYCQQCKVCICQKCREADHDGHTMMDIHEAANKDKVQMRSVINKLKPLGGFYQARMNKQIQLMERSKEENAAAHKKVTKTVEELIQVLHEHGTAIHVKLDEIHDIQQRDHSTQLENFQLLVTQLNSFVEYGEAVLERNLSAEILHTQSSYGKQGQTFLNLKKIELYDPQHVDYAVTKQGLIQGHVIVKHADASKSVAEGKGLVGTDVDTETNFKVTVIDKEGKQYYHKDDQMTVNVVDPQGNLLNKSIEDHKDGKYMVTYTPASVGMHTVSIDINDKALAGSPWKVDVMPHHHQFVFEFGTSGSQQGQFDWPVSIAVSKTTGNIAVADSDNRRIQLFNSNGRYLREFGQNGSEKLNKPKSVAFTSSGDVTVLDSNKIFMFNETGNFINSTVSEHLINPSSLSVGNDDHFLVCDKGNKKIKVLSSDGTELLRSFSAPDCGTSPEFAICYQNKIFVSYFEANCVKVFSVEGQFAFNIGNISKLTSKDRDGVLNGPLGLSVDKHGKLIVCDFRNRRLQLFTPDGMFISKIEQQLKQGVGPYSVAVSNDSRVLMIDILRHSIHVFQ